MRLKLSDLSLPLAVGLLAFGLSTLAQAESSYSDRIYADSFGNLVVHSRGGSKRIVVGQGALAQELADYERPHGPDVVAIVAFAGEQQDQVVRAGEAERARGEIVSDAGDDGLLRLAAGPGGLLPFAHLLH